ncbi:MAG: hypothetical protein GY739_19520 [Mesoflavibacter sp.]|nr:hypothetical protein [Mesoflavibacter sp.]
MEPAGIALLAVVGAIVYCGGGVLPGGACDYDRATSSLTCRVDANGTVRLPAWKSDVSRLLLRCGRPHARLLTAQFHQEVGRPFHLVGGCTGGRREVLPGSWLLTAGARRTFERLGVGAADRLRVGVAADVAADQRTRLRLQLADGGAGVELGTADCKRALPSPTQRQTLLQPSPPEAPAPRRRRRSSWCWRPAPRCCWWRAAIGVFEWGAVAERRPTPLRWPPSGGECWRRPRG